MSTSAEVKCSPHSHSSHIHGSPSASSPSLRVPLAVAVTLHVLCLKAGDCFISQERHKGNCINSRFQAFQRLWSPRTHTFMRFRACWTMSRSDTHTLEQVSPSVSAPLSKLIPPHWHHSGWPPSHRRIWLEEETPPTAPQEALSICNKYSNALTAKAQQNMGQDWEAPALFPSYLSSSSPAHCLAEGIFGGPPSI